MDNHKYLYFIILLLSLLVKETFIRNLAYRWHEGQLKGFYGTEYISSIEHCPPNSLFFINYNLEDMITKCWLSNGNLILLCNNNLSNY